jgi:palmitoyltransferase ZDHHC9/14/18/palmitoyltransferase
MNPGIVNPFEIKEEEFERKGKKLCKFCNMFVHGEMVHCRECEVCLENNDHHCGYFNKCIGGQQKFMFFATLTFGFLGFLNIVVLGGYLIMG